MSDAAAPPLGTVCVFCGSSTGDDPAFAAAARAFGRTLARRGTALVFGGGHVGLMGVIADATLAAGGQVVGVIPERLAERELAHSRLTRLIVQPSMHERKAKMASLADAFVAMPGGLGTLDELFEIWTWAQLGFHDKPIGLLNTAGFFAPLLELTAHMVRKGFVREANLDLVLSDDDGERLLRRLEARAGSSSPRLLAGT
ncbi:MAG TPA: TIGR00730 family Rossman fold protein [Polyangiaceae bacterium]|nr:TIGR00730 family Rossman fold protein [Polyangiaceae bacterium]